MEEEADVLKNVLRQFYYERKICLPSYKIICSLCFIVLLGLVRGISRTGEIGIVLDTSMPILAIMFCADLYEMEYSGKRWEIFCLYSVNKRIDVLRKRLCIQIVYLWMATIAGYTCFFWQCASGIEGISDWTFFAVSMVATAVSIAFFGVFSVTVATAGKNSWYGMGISLLLWLMLNSKQGEKILGKFNLFAFSFRNIEAVNEMGWMCGKGVAVLLMVGMLAVLPSIIKRR